MTDLRYAFRSLRASPGFTTVAMVSLALSLCIATCALSEMNGMVLRHLPGVPHPDELVALQSPVSYPEYKRFREQRDLWTESAAYVAAVPFAVRMAGASERYWGHLITPSYFETLGVRPFLGRFFNERDDSTVVVVSYRFWQQQLGADRHVSGRLLRINGRDATVVGVGPRDFLGASPFLFIADLWIPIAAGASIAPELANNALEQPDLRIFRLFGRLRPGNTEGTAEAELDTVARQIDRENLNPERDRPGQRVFLVEGGKLLPLRKQELPFFTSFLTIMAGLVMLIACANLANMLARAAARRREIGVRLALGAGRRRIIRQLLTESLLIAAAAGALGFLASAWLMDLSSRMPMPFPMPVMYDFRPDRQVLFFTTGLSFLTGVIFGLAPALQISRIDLTPALKEGGAIGLGAGRHLSLRNALMISHIAGSLTLLVILGYMSLGIQTTIGIQTGFDPSNLYLISVDPVRDGLSPSQTASFLDALLERVKALPAVASASLTETVPVSLGSQSVEFSAETGSGKTRQTALRHVVGSGYFETTGISTLAGRFFRKQEQANAVIVSAELARQIGGEAAAVGRTLQIGGTETVPAKVLPGSFDNRAFATEPGSVEIVGVAKDVAESLIVQQRKPVIYFPLTADAYARPSVEGLTLLTKARPGADVIGAVEHEISALNANVHPFKARSMREHIEHFMGPLRIAAWTYALIGIFGLVLAVVGLAGLTAYSVATRTREIGIRMALGARKANVLGLIMKEALVLVALGTIFGMAGAWAGALLLSAMNASVGTVTSTSVSDPLLLTAAPLLLAALTLLGCYLPARRSTRIDPVEALRHE